MQRKQNYICVFLFFGVILFVYACIIRKYSGKILQEDHLSLHHLQHGGGGGKDSSHKGTITHPSLPPIRVVVVKGAEDGKCIYTTIYRY